MMAAADATKIFGKPIVMYIDGTQKASLAREPERMKKFGIDGLLLVLN
jgi:hypothetical protein